MEPDLRVVLTHIPTRLDCPHLTAQVTAMATPPLPSNPSIDNPPLTPEPIREDPEPDTPNEPEEYPVDPDSSPKKVRGRGETDLCLDNPILSAILKVLRFRFLVCVALPISFILSIREQLRAQLPFYTDDTAVTELESREMPDISLPAIRALVP
jgi:hypothetical protein